MKKILLICAVVTFFTITACDKESEIPRPTESINDTFERHSGITFTNEELTIWRDRTINGPYKTTGDAFTYSPGAWDQVVKRANKFLNDEVSELWDGQFDALAPAGEIIYKKGHYLLAAAFYGLIKEDNVYRLKAKDAILAQARNANPVWEDFIAQSSWNDGFHWANLSTRLFLAFDYTYDLWTENEIAEFETWMDRAMPLYRKMWSQYYYMNWPNRDNNDWSVVGWWAKTGKKHDDPYYDDKRWTHATPDGTLKNEIYFAHVFPNARWSLLLSEFMWSGVYKNDPEVLEQGKRFIKEWLMFGTWPDGYTSENIRNRDYGRASTGTMHYGGINLESALLIAEYLRRRGDTEIYEFTTSDGIWGSEGGNKNLRLIVDTHMKLLTGALEHYAFEVTADDRIKSMDGGGYRYKAEGMLAIGNAYWKETGIRDIYKNQESGQIQYGPYPQYGGPSYTASINPYESIWVGESGIFPALPLMYYEMENVVPTP